ERHASRPIGHIELTVMHQQYTKSPINGSPPEIGAAHGHCRGGRGHVNVFIVHLRDLACCQSEGGHACRQHEFAGAFVGIENIAINCDLRVFAKSECGLVTKGDFKTRLWSRAKLIVHMYDRADNGGLSTNFWLVFDFSNHAHGGACSSMDAKV